MDKLPEKRSVSEDIKPTEEQKRILEARGRVIKINARAGTGKTTTLRLIAENHPNEKILYLVFNRKNREEAEKIFPKNVKIATVHAFARSSLSSQGIRFATDDTFNAYRFLPDFNGMRDRQILSTYAYNFMMFFLNSRWEKLEEAIIPYSEGHLNDEQKEIFSCHEDHIVKLIRRVSKSWNLCEEPCPHDFYLKISHIKKTFHRALEEFDLILVDEGQDLSQVMVDALKHCTKDIVLVGDTHQGIYSFRYAVDAMRLLSSDQDFDLSLSFRFGEEIASLVTHFIAESKGENHFRITGNRERESTIFFYEDFPFWDRKIQTAILSRTNMGLFKNAMHLRAKKLKFRFERDIKAELMRTLDVYWLYRGQNEQIRDEMIRSFDSLKQLDIYSEQIQDFQLSNISQIVKQYASEFPGAIFDMIKLINKNGDPHERETVILSTVHAAKGQEYERVIIDEDIVEAIDRAEENDPKQFHDEVNVAYVCLTRAKEELLLPVAMRTKFTTAKWRRYMESFGPKLIRREVAHKVSKRIIVNKPYNRSFPQKEYQPVDSTYKVGDRVKTSNGYGSIIAIMEGQYHIALDGQLGRLRENITALNFYNS